MAEAAPMRERLFTMRLSDEESARLDDVSKHFGLNAAGTIRMLVKREHDGLAESLKRLEARFEEHNARVEKMGLGRKKTPKPKR